MLMEKTTKITLAWELYLEGRPKLWIARRLGLNRETVHLWVRAIESSPEGLLGFLEDYLSAKKGPRRRKVDGFLKARIYRLREENRGCCGQKIQEFLRQEGGLHLSLRTIYKILGERYALRSHWKKNQARGPVPQAEGPRQVVQMDTVDFGQLFAFTGVDIFAKDAVVKLYPTLTSRDGLDFLDYSFATRFKHTLLLQADGGSEFKDHFRQKVLLYADRFRIARPYRKNEQAYIESFNRSLRKECLGWGHYRLKDLPFLEKELAEYLDYYHQKRPHLGLNLKTPNAILREYQLSDI